MTTTPKDFSPLAFPVIMTTLAIAPDGDLPTDIREAIVNVILEHGQYFTRDQSNLIMAGALLHGEVDVTNIADALIFARDFNIEYLTTSPPPD